MPSEFYIVRHGESEANAGRFVSAVAPGVSLTARGRMEAAIVARLLGRRPSRVVSSPFARALQTAAPLANRIGVPIVQDAAFAEWDMSQWEGQPYAQLRRDSEAYRNWLVDPAHHAPPGPESLQDVFARAKAGIERWSRAWPGEGVAIFSHADVVGPLLMACVGAPFEVMRRTRIPNASIVHFAVEEGGWRLLNFTTVASSYAQQRLAMEATRDAG